MNDMMQTLIDGLVTQQPRDNSNSGEYVPPSAQGLDPAKALEFLLQTPHESWQGDMGSEAVRILTDAAQSEPALAAMMDALGYKPDQAFTDAVFEQRAGYPPRP